MTGTLVNCAAVIIGGLIGLLLKKGIKESYTVGINKSLGLAVLVIGINGVIANMFTAQNGKLSSSGELLLIVFLVVGTLIGELLKLDDRFNRFCGKVDSKFKNGGFASGFINGTILFCVGAMSIIGSINDGLTGDSSVLFVKSALDFVNAVIFGATLGFGVIFTCIPMLIYQGGISLLAGTLSSILQGELLEQVCMVGYAIIMAIGFNFFLEKKFKTLNMVPAIILPVVYHYILVLIDYII
ncbi:MAG: DUF554 domain-containing protein [Clostridia bacterium]|nr:DUF554 domain-containing protein [Clostridia bacterium]MBQ2694654.1 DUF554 domain-containing protein [Clostridia bacterium]